MLSKTAGSAAKNGAGIWAEDGDVRLISEGVHVSTARPVGVCVDSSSRRLLVYSQRDARLYLAPVNVVVSFPFVHDLSYSAHSRPYWCVVFFSFLSLSLSLFLCLPRDLLRNDLLCNSRSYKTDVGGASSQVK